MYLKKLNIAKKLSVKKYQFILVWSWNKTFCAWKSVPSTSRY